MHLHFTIAIIILFLFMKKKKKKRLASPANKVFCLSMMTCCYLIGCLSSQPMLHNAPDLHYLSFPVLPLKINQIHCFQKKKKKMLAIFIITHLFFSIIIIILFFMDLILKKIILNNKYL